MAKQTLDLLDAVMIQDSTNLEPHLLKFGTRPRQPNNPIQKSLLPPHNYYTPIYEHVAQINPFFVLSKPQGTLNQKTQIISKQGGRYNM